MLFSNKKAFKLKAFLFVITKKNTAKAGIVKHSKTKQAILRESE